MLEQDGLDQDSANQEHQFIQVPIEHSSLHNQYYIALKFSHSR
jgi:hypothetical protein